jgi:hypothetical protein
MAKRPRTREEKEEAARLEQYLRRAARLVATYWPDDKGKIDQKDMDDIDALNIGLCQVVSAAGVMPNDELMREFDTILMVAFMIGRTNRTPLRTDAEAIKRVSAKMYEMIKEDIFSEPAPPKSAHADPAVHVQQ